MKKILLLLFFILTSCAARKVDINKTNTVVKIDSTSVTEQQSVTTQDNHVSITTDTDELEVCPLYDTIPMVVNGITYKNAKLRYKKTKKVLVDTTKIKVAEKASIKVSVNKNIKEAVREKKVDKKTNYSIYLWWILILLLIVLGYYTYKKINKTLF